MLVQQHNFSLLFGRVKVGAVGLDIANVAQQVRIVDIRDIKCIYKETREPLVYLNARETSFEIEPIRAIPHAFLGIPP